jgi:polyphosphate kinase
MPEEISKYFDRDLSWLSFNKRVLEEAGDHSVPLYERIKFLAIYSSNLDEFFRVRVATLRSIADIDRKKINKQIGVNPKELLKQILEEVNTQLNEFGRISREELMPELEENNIIIYKDEELLKKHRKVVKQYFKSNVLSYLQPVIINEEMETPPFLNNRALYFIVELNKVGDEDKIPTFATLNIPTDHLSRYFELPEIDGVYYFIHLDDIVLRHIDFLFPGYEVISCKSVKLNRDADLLIEDEYAGDLVEKIKKQLNSRNIGVPSRFLHDSAMPKHVLNFLIKIYKLQEEDIVIGGRYHNRSDLMSLPNPLGSKLEYKKQRPIEKRVLENVVSLFEAIEEQDHMLHFPYQSYDYVLRFFNEAAIDPHVKEIKATFYRVASDSFIMNALISAVKNGKKVTVFVELKARFDEENNLKWAAKLEREGIKIIYSIPGLKVHAKMALVIREVDNVKKGFAFLGTGNFNENTASIYTDHGLLTCHDEIVKEMNKVFLFLYKRKPVEGLKHLLVSQFNIVDRFCEMIDR